MQWIDVECPMCGAEPGEGCGAFERGNKREGFVHPIRVELAEIGRPCPVCGAPKEQACRNRVLVRDVHAPLDQPGVFTEYRSIRVHPERRRSRPAA